MIKNRDSESVKELGKIWSRQNYVNADSAFDLDLKFQQKLISLFSVGEYYYYIFHLPSASFQSVGAEVTQVLGYLPEEITLDMMFGSIHPDDRSYVINFEQTAMAFFSDLKPDQVFKYKVRYDYRIRKKNGQYLRILQQALTIQSDDNGSLISTLGVHTDISHLKSEGTPTLSFIGLDGEPSYENVKDGEVLNCDQSSNRFTKREKEILLMLIEGQSSKEIGKQLTISHETVNTHRRKMLAKCGALNTPGLINLAVKSGWI